MVGTFGYFRTEKVIPLTFILDLGSSRFVSIVVPLIIYSEGAWTDPSLLGQRNAMYVCPIWICRSGNVTLISQWWHVIWIAFTLGFLSRGRNWMPSDGLILFLSFNVYGLFFHNVFVIVNFEILFVRFLC